MKSDKELPDHLEFDGLAVVNLIRKYRFAIAADRLTLSEAEQGVKLAKAIAEVKAIAMAGGEKALGGNAQARERTLLIALAGDEDYEMAQSAYNSAYLRLKEDEAIAEGHQNHLKLILSDNIEG